MGCRTYGLVCTCRMCIITIIIHNIETTVSKSPFISDQRCVLTAHICTQRDFGRRETVCVVDRITLNSHSHRKIYFKLKERVDSTGTERSQRCFCLFRFCAATQAIIYSIYEMRHMHWMLCVMPRRKRNCNRLYGHKFVLENESISSNQTISPPFDIATIPINSSQCSHLSLFFFCVTFMAMWEF